MQAINLAAQHYRYLFTSCPGFIRGAEDRLNIGRSHVESNWKLSSVNFVTSGLFDWKYRKLYPLAEWSEKHLEGYLKRHKLILPIEYRYKFRDLNTFKGAPLLYIYNNYPDDYQKIIDLFPDVQGELMRALDGKGGARK